MPSQKERFRQYKPTASNPTTSLDPFLARSGWDPILCILGVRAAMRLGRKLKVAGDGRALLFPGEEDFGIVPVEAQAAGLPVIAYGVGGAAETVVDGVTGVLFAEQSERRSSRYAKALVGSIAPADAWGRRAASISVVRPVLRRR